MLQPTHIKEEVVYVATCLGKAQAFCCVGPCHNKVMLFGLPENLVKAVHVEAVNAVWAGQSILYGRGFWMGGDFQTRPIISEPQTQAVQVLTVLVTCYTAIVKLRILSLSRWNNQPYSEPSELVLDTQMAKGTWLALRVPTSVTSTLSKCTHVHTRVTSGSEEHTAAWGLPLQTPEVTLCQYQLYQYPL